MSDESVIHTSNLMDEHGRPYHPDMELSWQTYLGNNGQQQPAEVRRAFIAAWYAGRTTAHETLPVSVEFGGAHKGGYPKSGDRCHHCSGEWLPSPDGKGVWHNCHTGPATATVDPLSKVYDAFSIGSAARVPSTLLANVENARRRSECLSRIEHEFFTRTVQDEDGEDTEECPLSWGAEPTEYVEQFRGALAERDAEKAPVTSYAVAYDKLGWVCSICAGWNHPGNHICEHRSRPEHQPHAQKALEERS